MSGLITVYVIIPLLLVCVVVSTLLVRKESDRRNKFNDEDWHIEGLPRSMILVRCCNAVGCGCGTACITGFCFFLIKNLMIKPALKKSWAKMKEAEKTETVSPILCNEGARQQMKERIQDLLSIIQSSKSMTTFSKILYAAGITRCLKNHAVLLDLGMRAASEKVKQPVFIVGFPRTGTTILHRTMSLDRKQFRNFDLCDFFHSLPKPVSRDDMVARREIAQTVQNELDIIESLFPGWTGLMDTVHPFRSGEADEELGWYDSGLGYFYRDVLINLFHDLRQQPDGLISILEGSECAKYRYAWLDMVIRVYQKVEKDAIAKGTANGHGNGDIENGGLKIDRPWLLKDPSHPKYLAELVGQFPDAKLIVTHRDPAQAIPSLARLFICFSHIHHVPGAPGTTSKDWGRESTLQMHNYSQGIVDFTKARVGTPFALFDGTQRIDIQFEDFVNDGVLKIISRIYTKFFQTSPSDDISAVIEAYLKKDDEERELRSKQTSSLADFHLSVEDVQLPAYREMFLNR